MTRRRHRYHGEKEMTIERHKIGARMSQAVAYGSTRPGLRRSPPRRPALEGRDRRRRGARVEGSGRPTYNLCSRPARRRKPKYLDQPAAMEKVERGKKK
jgi:hypothetical protein